MKRIISISLAAIMLLSTLFGLASCGTQKTKLPEKVVLENVYTSETIELPAEVTDGTSYNISSLSATDDGNLIFRANVRKRYTDADGNESSKTLYRIFKYDTDGTFTKLVEIDSSELSDSYNGETQESVSENISSFSYVNGEVWVIFRRYYENWSDPENYIWETSTVLKKYGEDGNLKETVNLTEALGTYTDKWGEVVSPFIRSITPLPDGRLIILDSNEGRIYLVSTDFEISTVLEPLADSDSNYINNLFLVNDKIAIAHYDESWNMIISFVDLTTGELTAMLPEGTDSPFTYGSPEACYNGKFYFSDSTSFCVFDPETLEKKTLVNWINSAVNNNYISTTIPVADDKLISLEYKYSDDGSSSKAALTLFSPVGEKVEKYLLTYACTYLDYYVKEAIIDFNRSHPEHVIQVKDYSEYDNESNNYTGAETQLDLDILDGNVPDIISMQSLSMEKYARKGLLADLYKLIENDSERPLSSYFENVLATCEYNGKLCAFIPAFSINTLTIKSSIIGDKTSLSFDDLKKLQQEYPDASLFDVTTSRSEILTTIFTANFNHYINYAKASCNFTDGSFAELLELCASFPEEINWDEIYGEDYDWQAEQDKYKKNQTLLMSEYLYDFEELRYTVNQFGEDVTYVGYPAAEGAGHIINPNAMFAISSKSPFTDVAWEFVRSTTDKYDYSFSILRSDVDKAAQEIMQAPDNDDEVWIGGIEVGYGAVVTEVTTSVETTADEAIPDDPDEDEEPTYYYWNRPLEQSEVDMIINTIESATNISRSTSEIFEIVEEVVAPFFAGQKTADEVCRILQSRVTIYLSENS